MNDQKEKDLKTKVRKIREFQTYTEIICGKWT